MPSLIARVQEGTGSYGPALSALAMFSLAASMLVLQLRERRVETAAAAGARVAAPATN
jgi:hypothetical protein